jgi:hypothetical protein
MYPTSQDNECDMLGKRRILAFACLSWENKEMKSNAEDLHEPRQAWKIVIVRRIYMSCVLWRGDSKRPGPS